MTKRQLMRNIQRPTEATLEVDETNKNLARFIALPYEKGFGTSIGNALRRILLSSIEGYAITSVRITYLDEEEKEQVLRSEFQSITHVAEDTIEIFANLKQCRLTLDDDSLSENFTIEINRSGVITADVLSAIPQITVANPEQVLCTAMDGVNITMELQIEKGVGYRPAEEGIKLIEIEGTIPLDALYSPVLNVMIKVDKIRVRQKTDYDKLTLEVLTDGTLTPQDAVAEAAKVAKEHFTLYINFDESEIEISEYNTVNNSMSKVLQTPIESLELSARASNCLSANGIATLGDLMAKSEVEITQMRNFGKKSLEEIKDKLQQEWNLQLGMPDEAIQDALNTTKK